MDMDEVAIRHEIAARFADVEVMVASAEGGAPAIAWGDSFFYVNPGHAALPEGAFPFATIVTKDYTGFDEASQLNRPGIFRLNIGLSRDTYHRLFPDADADANANADGATDAPVETNATAPAGHDFTALDRLMPHPLYGPQHWVCVLNPSRATFESLQPLLSEAYQRAITRHRSSVTNRE